MRFYEITAGNYQWKSHPNGKADPGALQIELDITQATEGVAASVGSMVRIWGPGLGVITGSRKLFNQTITVKGGMAAGLPLANPAQRGILGKGNIQQAFGNWVGTEQTLDIVFAAGSSTGDNPGLDSKMPVKNITIMAKRGQRMDLAIQQALKQAFPGVAIKLAIGANIVPSHDQVGFFPNLFQFARFVRHVSRSIVGGKYDGLSIVHDGTTITVSDFQNQSGAGQVRAQDLIGFPTWIEQQVIQAKTVMRGDLKVGQTITLPQTFANTAGAGANNLAINQSGALAGNFQIQKLRHVGNSRQPSGESWVTIIDAIALNTSGK